MSKTKTRTKQKAILLGKGANVKNACILLFSMTLKNGLTKASNELFFMFLCFKENMARFSNDELRQSTHAGTSNMSKRNALLKCAFDKIPAIVVCFNFHLSTIGNAFGLLYPTI